MAQPEVTFRHGSCSASVYESEHERPNGEVVVTRSVQFMRRFKDSDGRWGFSSHLRTDDIPKAILVLQKSYEFLTANGWNSEEKE